MEQGRSAGRRNTKHLAARRPFRDGRAWCPALWRLSSLAIHRRFVDRAPGVYCMCPPFRMRFLDSWGSICAQVLYLGRHSQICSGLWALCIVVQRISQAAQSGYGANLLHGGNLVGSASMCHFDGGPVMIVGRRRRFSASALMC